MPEPELRLRWRKTWPDREDDFVALDRRMDGETVGRYQHTTGGADMGKWFWSLTAFGKGIMMPAQHTGYEPTARGRGKGRDCMVQGDRRYPRRHRRWRFGAALI